MIVFVRTKNETETLAEKPRAGLSAMAINGDVAQVQRERTVNQLKSGSSTSSSPPTSRPAASTSSGSATRQLRHPHRHRVLRAPHRSHRAGRSSGDAISFVTPREKYLLKHIEKATRQPLTEMRLPSVEDVNVTRLTRFDDQITAALADPAKIEQFRDIVAHYVRNNDVPEADVAAALAVVAQGDARCCSTRSPSARCATSRSSRTALSAARAPTAADPATAGPEATPATAPSVVRAAATTSP